jgi:hypothetical protein
MKETDLTAISEFSKTWFVIRSLLSWVIQFYFFSFVVYQTNQFFLSHFGHNFLASKTVVVHDCPKSQ